MPVLSAAVLLVTLTANLHTCHSLFTPATPSSCHYSFAEERLVDSNDVFVIDRSISVSQLQYNLGLKFISDLIHKRLLLREENTRIAAITFADDVRTVFDYVTSDDVAPECEVFHPGSNWDALNYVSTGNAMDPRSFRYAIERAKQIFADAKRKNVLQRLWILTDFHEITNAPDYQTMQQWFHNVHIYGVGINIEARQNAEELEQRFCNLTSGSGHCGCSYRRIGTGPDDWRSVVLDLADLKYNRSLSDYVEVVDEQVCRSHDIGCHDDCTCRELMYSHDTIVCETDSEEQEGSLNKYIFIIAALSAVVLLVLTGVFLLIVCRHSTVKTEVQSVGTTTDDLRYDIEGYLLPTDLVPRRPLPDPLRNPTSFHCYERLNDPSTDNRFFRRESSQPYSNTYDEPSSPASVPDELAQDLRPNESVVIKHDVVQDLDMKDEDVYLEILPSGGGKKTVKVKVTPKKYINVDTLVEVFEGGVQSESDNNVFGSTAALDSKASKQTSFRAIKQTVRNLVSRFQENQL